MLNTETGFEKLQHHRPSKAVISLVCIVWWSSKFALLDPVVVSGPVGVTAHGIGNSSVILAFQYSTTGWVPDKYVVSLSGINGNHVCEPKLQNLFLTEKNQNISSFSWHWNNFFEIEFNWRLALSDSLVLSFFSLFEGASSNQHEAQDLRHFADEILCSDSGASYGRTQQCSCRSQRHPYLLWVFLTPYSC
jgi:hypothetical protein